MNDWYSKDRSETASNRMPDRFLQEDPSIRVVNPALGINVYKSVIKEEDAKSYIDLLESKLNGQTQYEWTSSYISTDTGELNLEARNAKDFSFTSTGLGSRNEENAELYDMHEAVFQAARQCVDDYGRYWGVGIRSYEKFHFVKYEGSGTHFRMHIDHGPHFVSTVSIVIYLNEGYEGGDLWFPRLNNLIIKPKTGDILVFPSTYIYEHSATDIVEGTKYSVVIMSDYNDRDGLNHSDLEATHTDELKY